MPLGARTMPAPSNGSWGKPERKRRSFNKLRNELIGDSSTDIDGRTGWPFYPGAAAWVSPTAISILALEKAGRYQTPGIQHRVEIGRQFLMDRICKDGGWNDGRAKSVLGVDADSYPETTGQALLALHEVPREKLDKTLVAAEEQARRCRSSEGLSWLQLGLRAHGIVADGPSRVLPCRHVGDAALSILARAAIRGRNLFLE